MVEIIFYILIYLVLIGSLLFGTMLVRYTIEDWDDWEQSIIGKIKRNIDIILFAIIGIVLDCFSIILMIFLTIYIFK